MKKIIDKIETLKRTRSDINEHLSTLVEYSKECNHVTEFGVREAVSTWSFLLYPKKIMAYDIQYHANIIELRMLAKEYNIDFNFIKADDLKIEIEQTDLLFIDTLHCYKQLIAELNLHSKKVNKYIIMHNTVSYGTTDEPIYNHASEIVKNISSEKQGLENAYVDFLLSEEGQNWVVHEIFTNNNGLTILKRVK